MDWYTISEKDWDPIIKRFITSINFSVKRIYPNSDEYEKVIDLRYNGLGESGFIDKTKFTKECMRLERDSDSIILGLYSSFNRLLGTVTLNTITDKFPKMAMELEKKVILDHPAFHSKDLLEITKLSIINQFRSARVSLNLFLVTVIIAILLGKKHFWQVSRNIEKDINWRERFGFDYRSIKHIFIDESLNNMESTIGYLYLPNVLNNKNLSPIVKTLYIQIFNNMNKNLLKDFALIT